MKALAGFAFAAMTLLILEAAWGWKALVCGVVLMAITFVSTLLLADEGNSAIDRALTPKENARS